MTCYVIGIFCPWQVHCKPDSGKQKTETLVIGMLIHNTPLLLGPIENVARKLSSIF